MARAESTRLFDAATGRARTPRQERSAQRQRLIAEAAISVIAEQGLASLTHRLVAGRAGVSLAATTYYYKTKADIIADASAQLLRGYIEAFRTFADRHRDARVSFYEFVIRALTRAAGKHRVGTLAWCEIMLDAARHDETRALARTWFDRLFEIWGDIATALGVEEPTEVARSAIDIVMGLQLVVLPLGLMESQVIAVLRSGIDPGGVWKPRGSARAGAALPQAARAPRKADRTREIILSAAVSLLIAEGATGVTYRAIAKHAGLTPAAPTYYYPSIASLLQAAQLRLFESAKDRYRLVMAGVDPAALDVERLADLTATVFLREATQFAGLSLAGYPVRLEAARDPALRPTLWDVIDDQNRAWGRLLRPLSEHPRALDPLLIQSLFAGKLLRVLATGASTMDLTSTRREFLYDLRAVAQGRHWTVVAPKVVRNIKKR